MGFLDVAFLPSRASLSTTFLENCVKVKSIATTTCLEIVVWCKQGHAPCETLLLQQSAFLGRSNFMEIITLLLK